MSRIEQLISEIEAYIDSCKAQPFSNNKRIVVDKDEIEELLVELRLRTPEEIKKYQKIISNKDAILSNAKEQANSMLADATRQTKELIDEHEIMQRAYAQAQEIVDQAGAEAQNILNRAVSDADSIREGAIQYADDMLRSLQTIISHSMDNANQRFTSFMNSMQSSYDVVTANRNELSVQAPEESEAEEEPEQSEAPEDETFEAEE